MAEGAPPALGWREWLALPALGVPALKAKIDTGARTSALHAFELQPFTERGAPWVQFKLHPLRRNAAKVLVCRAEVYDRRVVSDSGGHRERRYVIRTDIALGGQVWPAEVTLTRRDRMLFRMLLGRTAMAGRFVVDPQTSYRYGRTLARVYRDGAAKSKSKSKSNPDPFPTERSD